MLQDQNALEYYMCEMLVERGLPLPKGYSFTDRREVTRTKEVADDVEYTMKCLQLAALDSIASHLRSIRRWVIAAAVATIIALLANILF